jgi:peptidoglycan/xylan/chitin deacetylase (PgdA/CDA1 family)
MKIGDTHSFYEFSAIVSRPKFQWPGGARIAVLIVPNIEHFELNDERGRMDVRNFARSDYGNRVAVWRMMDALDRHKIRASVALNASVCGHYPEIIEACRKREYELMGHGITNSQHLNEAPNAADSHGIVRQTVETIRIASGQPVRGWLGPGMGEVEGTLDVLKECGIEYVCDWGPADDQPFRMKNGLYVMPYSIDLNDMSIDRHGISARDFCQSICDAFDTLHREGREHARVLCISLHPFLMGTPHRIGHLEKTLEYIASHDNVWWARGMDILDAYRSLVERNN